MTKNAVAYLRISQANENAPSMASQEKSCRDLAAKHGYNIVRVLEDDGISATTGAVRPDFQELLDLIAEGGVDVVLAFAPDRLRRDEQEGLALRVLMRRTNTLRHTTTEGLKDFNDDDANILDAITTLMASQEGRTKAKRQRARYEYDYTQGLPKKGPRAFGWKEGSNFAEHEPVEAKAIKAAYKGILSDKETQYSIAAKWNAAGLTTVRGGVWRTNTVGQALSRPANAGWLVVNGERQPESKIKAIVNEDTYGKYMARKATREPKAGRKAAALLSGLLLCPCGERMFGSTDGRGMPIYRCRSKNVPGATKKEHASVYRPQADEEAVSRLLRVLRDHDFKEDTESATAPLVAQQTALLTKRAEWTDLAMEGDLDKGVFRKKMAALTKDLTALEEQITAARAQDATQPLRAAQSLFQDLGEEWPAGSGSKTLWTPEGHAALKAAFLDLPTEQQRAIFAGLVEVRLIPVSQIEKPLEWFSTPPNWNALHGRRLAVTPRG